MSYAPALSRRAFSVFAIGNFDALGRREPVRQ